MTIFMIQHYVCINDDCYLSITLMYRVIIDVLTINYKLYYVKTMMSNI